MNGTHVLRALVVVLLVAAAGLGLSGSAAGGLGGDFWDLPGALWAEHESAARVARLEALKWELDDAAARRAAVVADVAVGRVEVAEGLERFQAIARAMPGYRNAVLTLHPDRPVEEVVRADYRAALEEACDASSAAEAALRPQLEALFAPDSTAPLGG